MSKVISASDAAALIGDGSLVGAAALTLAGWPEELAIAMEKRFLAPGIDIQKDVVAQMGFVPKMAANVKSMPPEIFKPKWGGLKAVLLAKVKPSVKAAA